jgi:Ca2+-binding RTX toxin-like protein
VIFGGDGPDEIFGGAGDDVLDGGDDFDFCNGGHQTNADSAVQCEVTRRVP